MNKLKGLTDQATKRIGKFMQAQEEPTPEGGKPKVLSIEKHVGSSGGYNWDVNEMESPNYDQVMVSNAPELNSSAEKMSPVDVVVWILTDEDSELNDMFTLDDFVDEGTEHGYRSVTDEDLDDFDFDPQIRREENADAIRAAVSGITMNEVSEICSEKGVGHIDTTYNWGWWGPNMTFHAIMGGDEFNGPCVLLCTLGTYRNFGDDEAILLQDFAEEAPWWDLNITLEIETDQGKLLFWGEDTEAYYWAPSSGNNDPELLERLGWEEDQSIEVSEIEEKLDMNGQYIW